MIKQSKTRSPTRTMSRQYMRVMVRKALKSDPHTSTKQFKGMVRTVYGECTLKNQYKYVCEAMK